MRIRRRYGRRVSIVRSRSVHRLCPLHHDLVTQDIKNSLNGVQELATLRIAMSTHEQLADRLTDSLSLSSPLVSRRPHLAKK